MLSLRSVCRWLGTCLCSLLGADKSHLQNEIYQLQSWSTEKLVSLDLETFWVLACILIVNISSIIGNLVPFSLTGHLGLANIQFLLSSACNLLDLGDLHGLTWGFPLVSSLGHYSCSFQYKAILNGQFLPECPIWLYFTWEFFYSDWPSLLYCVLEYGKSVIHLWSFTQLLQAVTSCIKLAGDLINAQLGQLDRVL